mmetsp:Transcript_118340/g.334373  ORF Transcript_118340/g.334373 Transcript_118340/m.334373 type:complete len:114 (+) Transcript_118340:76-417(+)
MAKGLDGCRGCKIKCNATKRKATHAFVQATAHMAKGLDGSRGCKIDCNATKREATRAFVQATAHKEEVITHGLRRGKVSLRAMAQDFKRGDFSRRRGDTAVAAAAKKRGASKG